MTGTVSSATIAALIVTFTVSMGMPLAALLFVKGRLKANWLPLGIGAATFFVSALILESTCHAVVLGIFPGIEDNIWTYAVYGGLAAGLFEETGRFLAMKLLMKNTLSKKNGLMYGVGHGGIESVLIVGFTYLSNITISFMINSGQFDTALMQLDEVTRAQTIEQLSPLWTSPASMFYIAAIERIGAFMLQICLSYIVYRAVKDRKPLFYVLAVALHFFSDTVMVVLADQVSVYVAEGFLILLVSVLLVLVIRRYRQEKEPVLVGNSGKETPSEG